MSPETWEKPGCSLTLFYTHLCVVARAFCVWGAKTLGNYSTSFYQFTQKPQARVSYADDLSDLNVSAYPSQSGFMLAGPDLAKGQKARLIHVNGSQNKSCQPTAANPHWPSQLEVCFNLAACFLDHGFFIALCF